MSRRANSASLPSSSRSVVLLMVALRCVGGERRRVAAALRRRPQQTGYRGSREKVQATEGCILSVRKPVRGVVIIFILDPKVALTKAGLMATIDRNDPERILIRREGGPRYPNLT